MCSVGMRGIGFSVTNACRQNSLLPKVTVLTAKCGLSCFCSNQLPASLHRNEAGQTCMGLKIQKPPSTTTSVVFDLLNPIPFGLFVGALIFDVVYAKSADVMWFKSAAWLIAMGLLFAVVPRFINLFRVWFSHARPSNAYSKVAFFLYLLGIAFAIVNAFVHSRDAYAVIPEGAWLSILTVALLIVGNVIVTLQHSNNDHRSQT